MRQTETAQGAPDRHAMDRHLVLIGYFQHQIIQREVGLGRHPCRDPVPQTGQLAMPAAISLSARLQPACLAFQDHHVVHELHRNPKPRGRRSVRMTFLHKRDDPLTNCHRMWFTHLKPPYLPCRQGIINQASWESESESSQPAIIGKLATRYKGYVTHGLAPFAKCSFRVLWSLLLFGGKHVRSRISSQEKRHQNWKQGHEHKDKQHYSDKGQSRCEYLFDRDVRVVQSIVHRKD